MISSLKKIGVKQDLLKVYFLNLKVFNSVLREINLVTSFEIRKKVQ